MRCSYQYFNTIYAVFQCGNWKNKWEVMFFPGPGKTKPGEQPVSAPAAMKPLVLPSASLQELAFPAWNSPRHSYLLLIGLSIKRKTSHTRELISGMACPFAYKAVPWNAAIVPDSRAKRSKENLLSVTISPADCSRRCSRRSAW